jgi:predicted nuclease of predicted toxin-antitoxin system
MSASDQEIFDYARSNGCVLPTNDLDFPRILAHTQEAKPSVVLLRGEPLVPESRGFALLKALTDCEAELIQGAILSLDWSDQPRARILPLK